MSFVSGDKKAERTWKLTQQLKVLCEYLVGRVEKELPVVSTGQHEMLFLLLLFQLVCSVAKRETTAVELQFEVLDVWIKNIPQLYSPPSF